MENSTTKEEIRKYVISVAEDEGGFERGSLSEENEIAGTLGFDSLDRMDFIINVENRFNVRLNIDVEETLETFKDLIDAVWNNVNRK